MNEAEDKRPIRSPNSPSNGRPGGQGKPLTPEQVEMVLTQYALLGNQTEVARRLPWSKTAVQRAIKANPEQLEEIRETLGALVRGQLSSNVYWTHQSIGRHLSETEIAGELPNSRWLLDMARAAGLMHTSGRLLDDQPTAIVRTTGGSGNVEDLRTNMLKRIESIAESDPALRDALTARFNSQEIEEDIEDE